MSTPGEKRLSALDSSEPAAAPVLSERERIESRRRKGRDERDIEIIMNKKLSKDREKRLLIAEIVFLVLSVIFCAAFIATTERTLTFAPYWETGVLTLICCVLFWLWCGLTILFWAKLVLLRLKRDKVATRHWFARHALERWQCWIFALAVVGGIAALTVMCLFFFPETFYPTGTMKIHRVGSVQATQATFFIRDPTAPADCYITYRITGSGNIWQNGTNRCSLNSTYDYTAYVRQSGLSPNTQYEWRFVSNPEIKSFNTTVAVGEKATFDFFFSSCFLYNFPFPLQATAFKRVTDLKPNFIAFMGDLIYADVPILWNTSPAGYQSHYRQLFRNKEFANAFINIPGYYLWDDHEVNNDWAPWEAASDPDIMQLYDAGITNAWKPYVGGGNPLSMDAGQVYFDVDYGDTAMFHMDSRTNRTRPNTPSSTMLGEKQLQSLFAWLSAKNNTATFKLLFSGVGWTASFPGTITDSWQGYLVERQRIFEYIRSNNIQGVVFFSGDSHFAYAQELEKPNSGFYEFSASPVDAFDFTLSGIAPYSWIPFVPASQTNETIYWNDRKAPGSVTFIGMAHVDTKANVPFITVSFHDKTSLLYNVTLTLDQLNPNKVAV